MTSENEFDVEQYREEHESDEHWELRKCFILQWKDNYSENRLLCLARVFANIEFMGCRYPADVMKEIAKLSDSVAKKYRENKKTKLQRTFVSASDAAEDRARGLKRVAGIVQEDNATTLQQPLSKQIKCDNTTKDETIKRYNYYDDLISQPSVDCKYFNDSLFATSFGRFVLLAREWLPKIVNLQASCSSCGLVMTSEYKNSINTITINGQTIAKSKKCDTKSEARNESTDIAWERLQKECVTLVEREQFILENDNKITTSDVNAPRVQKNSGRRKQVDDNISFGSPVDSSVAARMMKLMGWTGGGLGVNCDGISEPIKPNLQQVHRTGLGCTDNSRHTLRDTANKLMRRYSASDGVDIDLVFTSEFTKEERAELHQVAKRNGLVSKSYGKDSDRFLVVRKKLNPFNLVQAVLDEGGSTHKYYIHIPVQLKYKTNI